MVTNDELTAIQAGELLQRRREELGLTQEQVVELTGIPRASYLSGLESGKIGIARSKYLPALARVLRLADEDIRRINPGVVIIHDAPSTPRQRPPFRMPDALAEAIERFSGKHPSLNEPRWQRYLASLRFRGGAPEDAEGWLDVYRDLVRNRIEPEDSP